MDLDSFVFSAVLLLVATSVVVALFRHFGLGSVLGLLVAGIIVGPHSPGPYVTANVEEVRHFTELGVVLLLFLIGLEMRPRKLWAMRREVFGLGSLQIVVSGAAISGYFFYVGNRIETALLAGLTFALSSTAFVMQIMRERGEVASAHGSTAFAVLLMQDLAVVPMLALIPIISRTGRLSASVPLGEQVAILAGMFAVVAMIGYFIVPRALEHLARTNSREAFFLVVMSAVFISAWAMSQVGLSLELGAFLMGMMLSGSQYNYQIEASVEPYKGLLMSLFFVAVGMSIDLGALTNEPLVFARHVLAIVGIKIVLLLLLCLLFGYGLASALRVSFLLAQSGEFGFILFGSAKALGVIDADTFVVAVGVISSTMLVTPLLARLGDVLASRLARGEERLRGYRYRLHGTESAARVIIGGFGRVGRTVATMLERSGIPYIAFDINIAHVVAGKSEGRPVYFGDMGDPELLAAARVERADLVVLTIDSSSAANRAVSHIRNGYPDVEIIARARDLGDCDLLFRAGASKALPEAVEGSLRLGAEVLESAGAAESDVERLLHDLRLENYALVRRPPEGSRKKQRGAR